MEDKIIIFFFILFDILFPRAEKKAKAFFGRLNKKAEKLKGKKLGNFIALKFVFFAEKIFGQDFFSFRFIRNSSFVSIFIITVIVFFFREFGEINYPTFYFYLKELYLNTKHFLCEIIFLNIFFDIISLGVTIYLLKKASKAKKSIEFFLLIIKDFLIAILFIIINGIVSIRLYNTIDWISALKIFIVFFIFPLAIFFIFYWIIESFIAFKIVGREIFDVVPTLMASEILFVETEITEEFGITEDEWEKMFEKEKIKYIKQSKIYTYKEYLKIKKDSKKVQDHIKEQIEAEEHIDRSAGNPIRDSAYSNFLLITTIITLLLVQKIIFPINLNNKYITMIIVLSFTASLPSILNLFFLTFIFFIKIFSQSTINFLSFLCSKISRTRRGIISLIAGGVLILKDIIIKVVSIFLSRE